jgi:hypothetical protein
VIDQTFRFCPRCGTELVPGHPFCPKCGFDIGELGGPRETVSAPAGEPDSPRPSAPRSSRPSIIVAALIVAAGLAAYGLLSRPQATGPGSGPIITIPGTGGQPAASAPSAPITEISFQSPTDGSTVTTKDVTVIGLAPPGLEVTRDVSFGLDQHANADSTGHWAIGLSLNAGQNELVFRLGDDRSTEKRLHVTYTPAG